MIFQIYMNINEYKTGVSQLVHWEMSNWK